MAEFQIAAPPANPRAGSRRLPSTGTDSLVGNPFAPMEVSPSQHMALKSAFKSGKKARAHVTFPAKLDTVISHEGGQNEDDGPEDNYVLYQTLYKYESSDPEDLTFDANEILQVTDEGDGSPNSWYYGRSQDGREGNFPGTYVRKIKLRNKVLSVDVENGGAAKAEVEKPPSPTPVPVPKRELQPHEYVLYQALYEYKSDDPDDLSFGMGDILRVTEEGATPEEWFYGQDQDGNEGSFPGTYVRKIKMQAAPKQIAGLEHT